MTDWSAQLLRAVLFVPGNDERKLARAGAAGADVVVIDLEDAVAEAEKTAARVVARDANASLAEQRIVAVRVNGIGTGRMHDDIAAVVRSQLSVLVVPKVEDVGTLPAAAKALTRAERIAGMADGAIALIPVMETPLGIARCEQIMLAAPSRTITAMFGLADFSAALGVDVTPEGSELAYARGRLINAVAAAGLVAPIDGPYLRLAGGLDGLLSDSRRSRALGFQGRVALHPDQVPVIARAFSELSADQVEAAQRIIDAFESAESRGVASIRVDGQFVDYPLYHRARAKLRRHEAYVRATAAGA